MNCSTCDTTLFYVMIGYMYDKVTSLSRSCVRRGLGICCKTLGAMN